MNPHLFLTQDQVIRLQQAIAMLLDSALQVDLKKISGYYVDVITPAHSPVTKQDEKDLETAGSWLILDYAIAELGKLQTELAAVLTDSEVQS